MIWLTGIQLPSLSTTAKSLPCSGRLVHTWSTFARGIGFNFLSYLQDIVSAAYVSAFSQNLGNNIPQRFMTKLAIFHDRFHGQDSHNFSRKIHF